MPTTFPANPADPVSNPRQPKALEGPKVHRFMLYPISRSIRQSWSAAVLTAALIASGGIMGAFPAAAQFATPQTVPQGGQQQQQPRPAPQQTAPRPAPQAAPRPAAPAPAPQARPAEPALVAPPPPRSVEGIAAVVNDDIISMSDLTARLQLALVSSGLPGTAEVRQRLTPRCCAAWSTSGCRCRRLRGPTSP